ncbi:hypothetical protein J6590_078703 [Homalodisca vitripennis]|nr:hypothetical protein J6590_078703 [Homalodisca vitripennis]
MIGEDGKELDFNSSKTDKLTKIKFSLAGGCGQFEIPLENEGCRLKRPEHGCWETPATKQFV